MIIGIHEYIAILMKFGKIMVISRVSSNFCKHKMSKKMKLFPAIQNQLYRDSRVFLRVIPEVSQHF
jgi:hypothetical protein